VRVRKPDGHSPRQVAGAAAEFEDPRRSRDCRRLTRQFLRDPRLDARRAVISWRRRSETPRDLLLAITHARISLATSAGFVKGNACPPDNHSTGKVLTAMRVIAAGTIASSSPSIKRTPLQKADVPAGTFEVITGTAEIAANTNIGRHSHPGIETGYVLEGELTLLVEGQPPLSLKPGDSYKVPERAIHDARSGDKPAKVLAVYVVEKGKPLATAAE